MARGAGPLGLASGIGAGLWVAALIPGSLAVLVGRAGTLAPLGSADLAALRFTLLQAALSALISCLCAIPLARALALRRFVGRGLLISLLGAPFLLPVVVATLGLLSLFGRQGLVNQALALAGLPGLQIYGLQGVVLAHLFLNLPLATRMLLQGWQAIPGEHFRLAAALGMNRRDLLRRLERPMLVEVLPGAALCVFLLCLGSFAVALILGGGPGASTVELAIYQAFRFEFDLAHTASLALMQMGLTVTAGLAALWLTLPAGFGAGLDRPAPRFAPVRGVGRDSLAIGVAALFLLSPLVCVLAQGLPGLAALPAGVWRAALLSVAVASVAAGFSLALGLSLALACLRLPGLQLVAMLALSASPVVIGAGLFLALRPWGEPAAWALPVTALVNGTLALPLVLQSLLPALRKIEADQGRLADHLGLLGWARLRWLILPRLRRPAGFAAGLAAALSMGDLGVMALFADPSVQTLPMQVFALMGAYRMEQAAGAALLLAALAFGLFLLCDLWGRHAGT